MQVGEIPGASARPVSSHNEHGAFPQHGAGVNTFCSDTMATSPSSTPFDCPNCGARYKVVRVEADAVSTDRQVTCRVCGAPFHGREGGFILKYFLVNDPKSPGRRPKSRRD
ncbi:MAG TPA: hypothetical protein VK442_11750 [Xanthobacteraceae bacterium]|nr:hypothetical protein [Xanthobacteraceae bacterium]